MSITLLYGCCQIETTARNLEETRRFFCDVLGGGPIEQILAKQIDGIAPGTRYACDHLGLGEAVFQVNQPDPGMIFNGHPPIHQAYLDRVGPAVTNLNFFVDDHVHARELLMDMGAQLFIEGPSTSAQALADYGPGNTRAGGDDRSFLFLGTRHLIGLDLEIMEPNFLRFADQTVQYPAYVRPRPATGDGNLVLKRLRIVVGDIDATMAHIASIFTPACRSRPYDMREGPMARAVRLWLGGIEIEYCQPLSANGPLAHALDDYGQGAITIEFGARSLASALARCEGKAEVRDEPDWLGLAKAPRSLISSRDIIGFDVVLDKLDGARFA